MSGYKDYLSEEMQGAIETKTPSKRTRLSQFRHGGYHSSMDEFFTAGKKSYGVRNVDVSQLGKYGSTGRGGNPRFSTAEFFGKNFMSNGGEVTTYNNPGNLEKGQGYAGETGNTYANDRERPFVVFDSPEMGVRALAMDLQTKIKRHEGDVNKIIEQYAPDNENDTKKYQEFVKQKLKKDKVTNKDLKFLVQAIIEKENKPEVASYYLENPDVMTKGLAMSYFQLPSGTSFEQAVNEISAKESTLKKVLKNRKPFRYGGGADASKSDFGGPSKNQGGNQGGSTGGSKDDTKGGNKPTMADVAGPVKVSSKPVDERFPNKGGGADASKESFNKEVTVTDRVKEGAKNITNKVKNTLSNVSFYGDSNVDFNNPYGSALTAYQEGIQSNIGVQTGFNTPIGYGTFGAGVLSSVSADDLKAGNFKVDKDFQLQGSLFGPTPGTMVEGKYNVDTGYGTLGAEKTFSTDLGGLLQNEISGTLGAEIDTEGDVRPLVKINLKRGGLLDRSRKK